MTSIKNALEHKDAEALFLSVLEDLTALKVAVDSSKALNDVLKSTINSMIIGFSGDYLDGSPELVMEPGGNVLVSYSAFQFHINGAEYSKAGAGQNDGFALAGDDILDTKFGAFAFDIESNGTVTCVPATDNGTGYSSSPLALAGIPAVASDKVRLGTVVVHNASEANFIPGTTALNATGITTTITSATPFSGVLPAVVSVANQTAVGELNTTTD